MDASEFSKELEKVLGVCRSAAELKLPIEAMLEHIESATEAVLDQDLDREAADKLDELNALREIVAAVGDVAAIGAKLPPAEPNLAELPCPLPANLRSPK